MYTMSEPGHKGVIMQRIRSLNEEITVTRKGMNLARIWYEQKRPDYPDAAKDYFKLLSILKSLLAERRSARKRLRLQKLNKSQVCLFQSPESILVSAEIAVRKSITFRTTKKHVKAILTLQHALQHVRMYGA